MRLALSVVYCDSISYNRWTLFVLNVAKSSGMPVENQSSFDTNNTKRVRTRYILSNLVLSLSLSLSYSWYIA